MMMMYSKTMLLLLVSFFLLTSYGSKVNYRQTANNKAFMESVKAQGANYEIVHPFQIRDKNDRIGIDTRNYFFKENPEHYTHITLVIRHQLGRLKLVLERNNFIFMNQTAFHKLDSDGERVIGHGIENCYYQGHVGGEEDSFVAVSSCNGLKGVISFANGTTYGVWPLDGHEINSRRPPHIFYKTTWQREAKCATSAAVQQRAKRDDHQHHHKHRQHHHHHSQKRDASKRTKYVEVAMIADYEFMKNRGLLEKEAISYMLESLNIADFMLRDLNIRLTAVYVELWTDVQRVDLHDDIEITLSGVVDYTTGHIYHIQKDATIFFTGASFANREVANAATRSICTARSAIIASALDEFATQFNGEIVAQNVGHLLGLEHDTAACSCDPPAPACVMRQQPGKIGSPFAWKFSKCSVARMHGIWQDGNIQCLLNKPFQVSELRECGNGIVDAAEECDCGSRETCNDPCCDPLTCTLRPSAQCAAHQKCCHRCELRRRGDVCRASQSSCDVAEQCDGVSGDCPPDGHLIDGTVCGQDGQCWRGNCSDAHSQCKTLWGGDARVAEHVCFEQNVKGVEYANCGATPGGDTLHKCHDEDVRCGTLHCHGGAMAPLDATLKAFTFQFPSTNNNQIQCKSIAAPVVGQIADGAACASGRVCVAGSCVEMSSVSAPVACPTNNLALMCSGHGHCTTTAKCVCFNGWNGNACDIRSNTSTYSSQMGFDNHHHHHLDTKTRQKSTIVIPHLNIGTTLETATLFAILLGVGISFLMCLVCLMVCYRRKSVIEIPKASDEKIEEEPGDRQIKFGNMPSYREEKRKRKSTKRIYGALNRITEADERDSASLRSRESAGSQNLLNNSANMIVRDPYDHHPHQHQQHIYADTRCLDGEYPLRSFGGSWRSISPASSTGRLTDVSTATTPLRLNKIGKLLKNMQQSDDEATTPFIERGGVPMTRAPPGHGVEYGQEEELSAVEADHELGSNTESARGGFCTLDDFGTVETNSWEPPGFMTNTNNTSVPSPTNTTTTSSSASQQSNNFNNFRQSPSLFSDPFKLEMTNSMHN